VKVRFIKKANNLRKIKWYGGVICGTANGRRIIKIHYDDGTSEVANFPDKDIIVDDVNNGRHGGAGGDGGGEAFVPVPSPMSLSSKIHDDDPGLMSSVKEEEGVGEAEEMEEEEGEEGSGDIPQETRQKMSSELLDAEDGRSPPTENSPLKEGRMDEDEVNEEFERETKPPVLSHVPAKESSTSEVNCSDTGRTVVAPTGMGISDMLDENEEESDGEIVEPCPLAQSSGREEKTQCPDNEGISSMHVASELHTASIEEGQLLNEDGEVRLTKNVGDDKDVTTLMKSIDKPQDEGPSGDDCIKTYQDDLTGEMNCPSAENSQQDQMKREEKNEISSPADELNASVGLGVEKSEVKFTDDAGFVGGVDSTPPQVASVIQPAAVDQSEEDRTEKKRKKRGPLSIHIGLPGAKRKKLGEGMKQMPQDETPIATANDDATAMDEFVMKKADVGDDAVEVDKPLPAPSRVDVKSHINAAQVDPSSLDTTSLKGNDSYGNSLSDGEMQEDGEIQEGGTINMEVDPSEVCCV